MIVAVKKQENRGDKMIFTIIGIISILVIFILVFIVKNADISIKLVNMNEAELNIKNLLNEKQNIINNIDSFLSNKSDNYKLVREDDETDDLIYLNIILENYYNYINEFLIYEDGLVFDDNENDEINKLKVVTNKLKATITYYDDNAKIYNDYKNKGFYKFIFFIKRYKVKELYITEKEEDLEEMIKKTTENDQ